MVPKVEHFNLLGQKAQGTDMRDAANAVILRRQATPEGTMKTREVLLRVK